MSSLFDAWFDSLAALPAAGRLGAFDPLLATARMAAISRWGPGVSAMVSAGASRYPRRIAVADEDTELTYTGLDRRATNVGAALRDRAGDGAVGILCRNHAGFLVAQVGAERAGCDIVMVSTALPGPKLGEVVERERISVLVHDDEFADAVDDAGARSVAMIADRPGAGSLAEVANEPRRCSPPRRRSNLVLLTSGTTGPPKGARRRNRAPGVDGLSLLTSIPYRVGDTTHVAPPLFHAWGLSQATIALATCSTLILRRKFDATAVLELLASRRIDVLAVVPLMLRRMLRHADEVDAVRSPRVVASSGNVLSGELATEWMDRFGDNLHNLYGSTEVAIGTVAGPVDLRAAPGTVGRPPTGVTVTILDDDAMPVPQGQRGWVHVSNGMQFDGYTDGSDRDRSGTLMATGDLGHFDAAGRLHVSGRANDMIITGGENVFPSVVEEVLDRQRDVDVAAVVGIDDEEFGQRIVAFVVARPGAAIDVEALRDAVAVELPSFMVPREITLVDALPMTTTGKVIRHRLAVLGRADRV